MKSRSARTAASTPRRPLSRDQVLQAALEMADQTGLDSLSMRQLGKQLGVEAMSLYKHVANKDEILDGIVDLIVGRIELPSGRAGWKPAMRRRCVSAHEVLMKHPWATMLIVSRVNVGASMLRYIDATLGCLFRAGFSVPLADHAHNALDSFVYGFTLHKLNFPFEPGEYAAAARSFLPQIPAAQYPHMHAISLELIEGRHDGINHFEFGLDLLLAGLDKKR